ncbi:MAG: pleD 2 [Bacteroidetes bacterium]|jgi:PAS domain S-box-containing protein|nr:pleD 2 [Bacteroidota bacterium]
MIEKLKIKPTVPRTTETEVNLLRKGKILIIDDSMDNIRAIAKILKEEEYDILTAHDPMKGISIAESKLPDMILLDVIMPGINGYKVCETLKNNKHTKDIPILFLTSLNDSDSTLKGFQMGAVDYINKPFNRLELLARIKNHLNIKLSQEHGRALFESIHHTYITLNKDLRIVNYNTIANIREELFGKRKFIIGDNIFNYIGQEDHSLFKRKIEGVFAGKVSGFEKQYLHNETSSWFNYVFEPIISKQGEVIGCLINGTDITEKKGFELRVQEYTREIKQMYLESKESLEYASYVQNALFPTRKEFTSNFEEHFLICKPKDIVNGDFYWIYPSGSKLFFVLGDCTGHGVAGALLTTISIVLLERIIKHNKITLPDEILHEMDLGLKDTLRQKEGEMESGLEIAVCVFDKKKRILEFAGAKRSLFMTVGNELIEIKGNRFDLGGSGKKIFKKQHVDYDKHTSFYMFSDGITDQIGGEKRKRFMTKNLFRLIDSNKHRTMTEQKKAYEHAIKEWMRDEVQTDDLTLIGLKVM